MSYTDLPRRMSESIEGFGRVFVSAPADFSKVAFALSPSGYCLIELEWLELKGQQSSSDLFKAFPLEMRKPKQRYGAEFSFDAIETPIEVIASSLVRLGVAAFDMTAPATSGELGKRFAFTPSLGLFHGQLDHAGSHVYSEHQLTRILNRFKEIGSSGVFIEMMDLLSTAWDSSLAPDHAAFDFASEFSRKAS